MVDNLCFIAFFANFACCGSTGAKGCFFGGSDSSGTGTVAGCDGGKEPVTVGILAISKLQGRFVTQRDVDGNITKF